LLDLEAGREDRLAAPDEGDGHAAEAADGERPGPVQERGSDGREEGVPERRLLRLPHARGRLRASDKQIADVTAYVVKATGGNANG
jgi:hypothetical protein